MSIKVAGVDAFSSKPMQGNGAAVVLLDQPAGRHWMQALAAEFNQSETAFLWQHKGEWLLRWFTPACEVDLCGHATLAATLALHHWGYLAADQPTTFSSRSGRLPVRITGDRTAAIELPSGSMQEREPEAWMAPLAPVQQWTSTIGYGVLLLSADSNLSGLDPDDPCWGQANEKAWLVMQAAPKPHDYQLRFFAPGLGLREDPVTGSAHALVAPWWCHQLQLPAVKGWQPSHRPGGLCCQPLSTGMIRLSGEGVILWDGSLHWPDSQLSADPWLALTQT